MFSGPSPQFYYELVVSSEHFSEISTIDAAKFLHDISLPYEITLVTVGSSYEDYYYFHSGRLPYRNGLPIRESDRLRLTNLHQNSPFEVVLTIGADLAAAAAVVGLLYTLARIKKINAEAHKIQAEENLSNAQANKANEEASYLRAQAEKLRFEARRLEQLPQANQPADGRDNLPHRVLQLQNEEEFYIFMDSQDALEPLEQAQQRLEKSSIQVTIVTVRLTNR